ncbi:MAG: hypothetical protein ONB46_23075 [candidate division KSB1 bacterium]|nr:hypothetical protein [candidate division KSB1 bacterium]MDZ7368697.1 hypothetical protein [candidate division KSB1 bacterium]MDZ7406562.1 hypothetical protein [candidate division KSB1 bacterium]
MLLVLILLFFMFAYWALSRDYEQFSLSKAPSSDSLRTVKMKVRPFFSSSLRNVWGGSSTDAVKLVLKASLAGQTATNIGNPIVISLFPFPKIRWVKNLLGSLAFSLLLWLLKNYWDATFKKE